MAPSGLDGGPLDPGSERSVHMETQWPRGREGDQGKVISPLSGKHLSTRVHLVELPMRLPALSSSHLN